MPDPTSIQTVFGSINSVIDQTTNSILKIQDANAKYRGLQPNTAVGAYPYPNFLPRYTPSQWAGVAVITVAVALVAYFLYREFK